MTDQYKQAPEENEDQELNDQSPDTAEENADQEVGLSKEELLELCKQTICPECPEKEEMDAEILRIKADADNYRKRMTREKEEYRKYAVQNVFEDIVPVIDNLELAIEHGRNVEACKDLVQGVEMTIKIFLDTVKKHGLEQIQLQPGDVFDPAWHEAMAEEEREDMEPGRVCQIMQKGYKLNERLLRPAKVMVSKKC